MWKFLLLSLCLPCISYAQKQSGYYTDILRDEKGMPITGATVFIQSTRQGTVTDKNGYFKIFVTEGNVLHISSVGYVGGDIKITANLLRTHALVNYNPVATVLSTDYTSLIQAGQDSGKNIIQDSFRSTTNRTLQLTTGYYPNIPIREINIQNNKLQIYPGYRQQLAISGSFNTTVEIKSANRTPSLQTQYAQGRTQNGALVWRGAETGEAFSFGPPVQSLAFDGSTYDYDSNGRLVAAGTGNGKRAIAYDNSILRNAFLHSQSFDFNSSLMKDYNRLLSFKMKIGQTNQGTIIRENNNRTQNLFTSITVAKKGWSITGTYSYIQDKLTNSNRNGFLSRVYQNALLTPISFDTRQGYLLRTRQRSHSYGADNPYFLLAGNTNGYQRSHNNGGLVVEKRVQKFSFNIMQSYEAVKQISNETYKPGTAYFENGLAMLRVQRDNSYSLRANTICTIPFSNYNFRSSLSANYNLNAANTSIHYTQPYNSYHYQRTAQDISINNKTSYNRNNVEVTLDVANKIYQSNTATQKKYFLPFINASIQFRNVLDVFTIDASSSYNSFVSELPINQSLAYTNLLQYTAQQSFQFLPVQEVESYKHLAPIRHNEWSQRVSISYENKITLNAEVFSRHTSGDIFPVYENGKLYLKNVAGHRNNGVELGLSVNDYYRHKRSFSTQHSLTFFSYNSRVTEVENGYNYLPVAGFNNVHKAIVKGQPLGVIVGNTYLRDANGNSIIGADGFPLVNNQPKVIGNAIPDFIMKLNNTIRWKKLSLNIGWEWKKGGEIWNGTQATLDYFGRSENSVLLRTTSNYVFPGMMQDGSKNTIPVSFLDLNKPVENNRWTRYGFSGVAEEYIQQSDYLKINSVTVSYKVNFKKYIQAINLSASVNNILLWSAYKGADPNQLLFDISNSSGLDFFNLPSFKSFGLNASIQF